MDGDKKAAIEAGKEQECKGIYKYAEGWNALDAQSKRLADAIKIFGERYLLSYPRQKCDRN